jgi:serine phosphatase RsbU (regulator of sigma subunit)
MQSQPVSVECRAGDALILFTDGLVESCDAGDTPLEEAGMLELLTRAPEKSAEGFVAAITAGEAAHRGAADPQDDLTALVFCFQ